MSFDAWPFSVTSNYGGFVEALDVAWSSFALHSIRTLEIGVAAPYTAQQWYAILSRFAQLETLAIVKTDQSFARGAFAKNLGMGSNNVILLPKLTSLTIDTVKFRDFAQITREERRRAPGMGLEEFLDMLTYRSQQGSPLMTLVIKDLNPRETRPSDMDSFFHRLDHIVAERRVGVYIDQFASDHGRWRDEEDEDGEEEDETGEDEDEEDEEDEDAEDAEGDEDDAEEDAEDDEDAIPL
ncbi:unnamed protein product [Peniophora sp. CBMAI 1063]|nr:unnamed protein product [Peniophora sp. CBMAI 1063]